MLSTHKKTKTEALDEVFVNKLLLNLVVNIFLKKSVEQTRFNFFLNKENVET